MQMPERKYLIHKAVTQDAVLKKHAVSDEQLTHYFIAQPKHDGVNCIAVIESMDPEGVTLWTRTGEPITSAPHVCEALAKFPGLQPCVLLGELWAEGKDFHEISGAVRRKRETTDWLQLVVFDHLTLDEFVEGYSPLSYVQRAERLPEPFSRIRDDAPVVSIVSEGTLIENGLTPDEAALQLIALGGYDGLILRDPAAAWKASDGKNGAIIKVKPPVRVTYQVSNIFSAVGEKTGRTVYTLEVRDKNARAHVIGSGVPHSADKLPGIGQLVEIEAMGFQPDGALREPRYKGIRDDVTEID